MSCQDLIDRPYRSIMMDQLFHDVSIPETAQAIAAAVITGIGPDELPPLKPYHVIRADALFRD